MFMNEHVEIAERPWMRMGILATDYDTHPAWKWAEVLLNEFVPTVANCSINGRIQIAEAKTKLRPYVVELLDAIRTHECQSYLKFNKDDTAAVAAAYQHYHGLTQPNGVHFHTLHKDIKGKIRASSDWADQCVHKICRIAAEIDGNMGGHNAMIDEAYRILEHWINSMQMCERSHFVSSNELYKGN